MSEYRRKSYYKPRQLIEIDRVLTSQFDDILVCITGAELEILRNLLNYAHYRSTWVAEYHENYYLAPSNAQWDTIQAIVADLEDKLMGCDDIVTALNAIQAQLACLCTEAQDTFPGVTGPAYGPIVDDYYGDGTVQSEDTYGPTTPLDPDRCAIAQLTWAHGFEFMDETVMPLQDKLLDILLPAAMGALGLMIGGPVLGIPIATITAMLAYLGEVAGDGQLEDLRNDMLSFKEDLVCAIYEGLATDYAAAASGAADVIADMPAASPIDKAVLKLAFGPWAMRNAQTAYTNNTAWAQANVTPGYCDECGLEIGSDWFAVRIDELVDVSWGGGDWQWSCIEGPLRDGKTTVGFLCTVVERGAVDVLHWQSDGGDSSCTGQPLPKNSSTQLLQGESYYNYQVFSHNADEVISTLLPGAHKYNEHNQRTGPGNWEINFRSGNGTPGTVTVRVEYIVYAGTP